MVVFIVAAVALGLSFVVTVLHLVSGAVRRRRLIGVDYTVILAFVIAAGLDTEALLAAPWGVGAHVTSFSLRPMLRLFKLFFAWRATYPVAKCTTQLAILYSLKEAFSLKNRYFRISWSFITSWTILSAAAWVLIILYYQAKVNLALELQVNPTCLSENKVITMYVAPITFGASSVMLLALPILPIWFAKVSWKRKCAMVGLWFVGFFDTWCIGAFVTIMPETIHTRDFSYFWADPLIMSVAEVSTGLFIACVPAIAALFTRAKSGNLTDNDTRQEERAESEDNESEDDSSKPLIT